jgi:flavin-dependent dehydrogenase
VAVVGAGVAGSSAAIRLARRGCRVLLLERDAAPRDKICGEFIAQDGQEQLAGLGLDLPKLGAQPIDRLRLLCGDGMVEVALPFQGLSLSRRVLDQALLLTALSEGADIARGAAVQALTPEAGRWRISRFGADPVLADSLFLATGKQDLRGWRRQPDRPHEVIAFKLYFRLTAAQQRALAGAVEVILFDGGYAGLAAVEDGRCNLSLVAGKGRFAACGKSWGGLLAAILEATPLLAQRLAWAEPCWRQPLAMVGVPYGFVHKDSVDQPARLYRLGDQMAVIPSFSGSGLSIALSTAAAAVAHHQAAALDADSGGDGAPSYHRQMRHELGDRVASVTRLARWAVLPLPQRLMLSLCALAPPLLSLMARQILSSR